MRVLVETKGGKHKRDQACVKDNGIYNFGHLEKLQLQPSLFVEKLYIRERLGRISSSFDSVLEYVIDFIFYD